MPRLLPSLSVLAVLSALPAGCGGGSNPDTTSTGGADSGLTTAAGCATDKTAVPFTVGMHESADSGVTVAIVADPPVPSPGDQSTWKLTVTDKSGAPVPTGTKVAMICKMTHAGYSHGCPSKIQVTEVSEGVYEAKPIVFNMSGHWEITFQVNGTDEIRFQFCIE